jgi:hypothetical protein
MILKRLNEVSPAFSSIVPIDLRQINSLRQPYDNSYLIILLRSQEGCVQSRLYLAPNSIQRLPNIAARIGALPVSKHRDQQTNDDGKRKESLQSNAVRHIT